MKILIVGDIHLGDGANVGQRSYRADFLSARKKLEQLIPLWQDLNPDLVIQLGDLIMSSLDQDQDEQNLMKGLNLINQIEAPIINLLGNHELRSFNQEQLKEILPEQYGYRDLKEIGLLWLDCTLDDSGLPYLADDRLNWLKNLKPLDKPVVTFSHYPLTKFDNQGSFYFQDHPQAMQYQNYQQINQVLSHLKPRIFVSGHAHLAGCKHQEDKCFILNPAFSEDLTAQSSKQVSNPSVYSIFELQPNSKEFTLTSYSGKWSFAKVEGVL